MLILTRREGESIIIGEDVVVTILEIEGGTTKVGIDAPEAVQILRDELIGSRMQRTELSLKT